MALPGLWLLLGGSSRTLRVVAGDALAAGEFLQLNPYEAKWIIASSLNKSPLTTTQLLWEKYHPQYRVWIPFAAIGFVAIIALAIFGQMAKRWGDMNA